MDPKSFENSTSGRLVTTRINLVPYSAFLPNPLPPEITPSWKLTSLISEADRAVSELAGVGRTIPDPAILIEPFMRREAVLSSRIEGTHTGLEELYSYESGYSIPGFEINPRSKLENQEVFNYVTAMRAGLEWIKQKPINLDLLRQMNRLLLYGVRGDSHSIGKFRDIQNFIGRTNDPEDAIFIPPPVEDLSRLLREFEKYLKTGNQYPPLIRIGLLHYQFETIHPFIDGNGRVGRLLIALLLVAWGLLPSPLLYLSAYFEKDRDKYYQGLLNVSQKGTWEEWLIYFLTAVITQSNDAVSRSRRLIDLREVWRKKLNQFKSTSDLFQIVDHLFEKPYLSIKDVERMLKVTNRSAAQDVAKLQKIGILSLTEDKKWGRVFEAKDILEILRIN